MRAPAGGCLYRSLRGTVSPKNISEWRNNDSTGKDHGTCCVFGKESRRMELYGEMKLRGDGYGGGFSCGMTMCRSETMEGFSVYEETEGRTVYRNDRGVTLTVSRRRDGEALRVRTAVCNGSSERIGLEMLASFAVRGVKADRIHRL